MNASNILEYVALAAALAGLMGVLAEILVNDPGVLREIVTDVRAMAEPAATSRPRPADPCWEGAAAAAA